MKRAESFLLEAFGRTALVDDVVVREGDTRVFSAGVEIGTNASQTARTDAKSITLRCEDTISKSCSIVC
jgi:hypothetical protein